MGHSLSLFLVWIVSVWIRKYCNHTHISKGELFGFDSIQFSLDCIAQKKSRKDRPYSTINIEFMLCSHILNMLWIIIRILFRLILVPHSILHDRMQQCKGPFLIWYSFECWYFWIDRSICNHFLTIALPLSLENLADFWLKHCVTALKSWKLSHTTPTTQINMIIIILN